MVVDNGLAGFSTRLNSLCDARNMPVRGRAELLSKKFSVTREAARKWLKAMSYPTLAKRAEICQFFGCTDAWLMSGKGDQTPMATNLTAYQRLAMEYMQDLSPQLQALAVRLIAQLQEKPEPEGPMATGSGEMSGTLRLEPQKSQH